MKKVILSAWAACVIPLLAFAQSPATPQFTPGSVKYSDKGLKPAVGRAGSATVQARALIGKDGQTELEVTTWAFDTTPVPFPSISKIQLQAFDKNGNGVSTTNYNNLTGGGYFMQMLAGMVHGEQIDVQANVDSGLSSVNGNDVATLSETVKLRPDLEASQPTLPGTVILNSMVSSAITVRELNGEVGAYGNCGMYVDRVQVDGAPRIWVDAGGRASCLFTYAFTVPGTHQVTYTIENVFPGDYDTSNNSVSTTVQVVLPPSQLPVWGLASASDVTFTGGASITFTDSANRVATTQVVNQGHSQRTSVRGWTSYGPNYVRVPVTIYLGEMTDGIATFSANTQPYAVSRTDLGNGAGRVDARFWDLNAGAFGIAEYVYDAAGNGYNYLQYDKYAANITYWSSTSYQVWGDGQPPDSTYYTGPSMYGAMATWGSNLQINISISDGTHIVTVQPVVPLQPGTPRNYNSPLTCATGSYHWPGIGVETGTICTQSYTNETSVSGGAVSFP